jgi:hypothetical protein
MNTTRWVVLGSTSVCLCLRPLGAAAATAQAASCSQADVQAGVDAASGGDTVVVPPGRCTWTTPVVVAKKGIVLEGAGVDQTTIADQSADGALLITGASAAGFVTVTGFTFEKGSSHAGGLIAIDGKEAELAFRVHHVRTLVASCCTRGIETTGVYGLIDHVTFDVTATSGSIQSVSVTGSPDGTDGGFTPWARPLALGTDQAVTIEDDAFNYGTVDEDCIDAYGGARLVVRHNTFRSAHIGFHGFDSGNRRSVFSYEIYGNTFTNDSTTTFRGATLRGGTGVLYDNAYGGTHGSWYDVTMLVYRACPPLDQSAWGACDGTSWELGATDFSAQASRTASVGGGVKFCSLARDTLCRTDTDCAGSGGGTCSTYVDGSGPGGYACRDQIGRTHDQALSPVYGWNNGSVHLGTYDGGYGCGLGLANYLQSGRDYIDGTPMPGYAAYAYPHPLVGGASDAGGSGGSGSDAASGAGGTAMGVGGSAATGGPAPTDGATENAAPASSDANSGCGCSLPAAGGPPGRIALMLALAALRRPKRSASAK